MNKRHYEHTLPNIRGSLSNTYIGKEDGETIRIEHIRQLQLQSKDSTNIFNQSDNGRKRSEE